MGRQLFAAIMEKNKKASEAIAPLAFFVCFYSIVVRVLLLLNNYVLRLFKGAKTHIDIHLNE